MKKSKHYHISAVFLIGILAVVVLAAYVAYIAANIATPANVTVLTAQGGTSLATFTGTLKERTDDLNLLEPFDPTYQGSAKSGTYYDAGEYNQGALAGYHRVIAITPDQGPGGAATYVFATKDYKTYILDGDPSLLKITDSNSPIYPFTEIAKNKVSTIERLPSDLPESLALDSQFSLYGGEYATTGNGNDTAVDGLGNPVGYSQLTSGYSDTKTYTKLASPYPGLSLYSVNDTGVFSQGVDTSSVTDAYKKYTTTTTDVIAVDALGLARMYTLTTPKNITQYVTAEATFIKNMQDPTFANDPTKEYNGPSAPALTFTSSDITGITPDYPSYGTLMPPVCSIASSTMVLGTVTNSQIKATGSVQGIEAYLPEKSLADIFDSEYTQKAPSDEPTVLSDSGAVQVVDSVTGSVVNAPSEADYIAKNPVIFLKDFWGRVVGLGESQYQPDFGGCGKPVVYLYPQKTTQVHVSFTEPMQLTTSIPPYTNNGWNVIAQPNGVLTDLQKVACSGINTTAFGSEYAASACAQNQYPYLYWAGNTASGLPPVSGGWVITQGNLTSFMNSTLDSVGFTAQEKSDMLSFWLPEMLKKNAPYYEVSFLQTAQMNTVAPMDITPKPDSVNRLFLEYTPLTSAPAQLPQPQVLQKFVRNGFTVVEWGGRVN